jgi:iron(III) transport system ATP-binding protein
MLDLLGCGHLGDRYPSQLSGGQQQRVAVGRGLIGHPETVLFDEPLSNIDAQLRRRVRAEIRRLHKKLKFTAVWVTHDQEEGLELADRIAVMQDGQIVQLGSPSEIYDRPASAYVANFIGIENRFTIEINSEGATGDIGVLSGPWNRLAPGLSGRFEVFLRSRSLRCRPSEEPGSAVGEECRIKGGVLTDALFSGRETESIVEYGDHRLYSADAERVNQSQIGQPVTCLFDVKNAFVFPISDAHACSAVPSEGPS